MSRNIQAEVTTRILDQLRAGVVPWRKPWSSVSTSSAMPRNAITNRAYSGVNVLLLWLTAQERAYSSNLWATFNQARDAGAMVRKGEKGTTVVFVSTFTKEDKNGVEKRLPFLKAFTVFNIAQIDGLNLAQAEPVKIRNEGARDVDAEAFMRSTGATIRHGEGRAYYRPAGDFVMMPDFETFENASRYYATAFHELTHWTGAESRLDRTFGKRFGDNAYSAEELVAELGASFLCAEFGFDNDGQDAAYIATWIKFLTDHESGIVAAASAASKAVDFMRGKALAEEVDDLPIAA